ncbi:MAG: hypothetical protein QM534_16805 [Sediminibacterium sp.]|nr:hypothetical protein [Sediminibacterium sp.]
MKNDLSSIITIRALFNVAHVHKKDCEQLIHLTENKNLPVIQAYHAAATMVYSKYFINPFKATQLFNTGKTLLEDLISENYDDIELHYLRYTIQLNTPIFLGYNKSIPEDRKLLSDFLKNNLESDIGKHMMVFINNTQDELLNLIN